MEEKEKKGEKQEITKKPNSSERLPQILSEKYSRLGKKWRERKTNTHKHTHTHELGGKREDQ